MLNNRRGDLGDITMIFVYLFFIVIIGVGIFAGIYLFFIQGYEFREAESDVLNYKVSHCILDNNIDSKFIGDFYNKCALEKGVVEKYNLIRVCKNSDDCVNERDEKAVLIGQGSKFQACRFEGGRKNDAFPRCVIKNFVKDGQSYEVITGSTQNSRRSLG